MSFGEGYLRGAESGSGSEVGWRKDESQAGSDIGDFIDENFSWLAPAFVGGMLLGVGVCIYCCFCRRSKARAESGNGVAMQDTPNNSGTYRSPSPKHKQGKGSSAETGVYSTPLLGRTDSNPRPKSTHKKDSEQARRGLLGLVSSINAQQGAGNKNNSPQYF